WLQGPRRPPPRTKQDGLQRLRLCWGSRGQSPLAFPVTRPARRPRTASRLAAVQALFQSEQAQENPETVIDQFVRHRLGELPGTGGFEDGRVPDAEVPLLARILRGGGAAHEPIERKM